MQRRLVEKTERFINAFSFADGRSRSAPDRVVEGSCFPSLAFSLLFQTPRNGRRSAYGVSICPSSWSRALIAAIISSAEIPGGILLTILILVAYVQTSLPADLTPRSSIWSSGRRASLPDMAR
jgi:hypothetical protein